MIGKNASSGCQCLCLAPRLIWKRKSTTGILMIDLKNRVVFVRMPKTAGSSHEQCFLNIRELEERDQPALGIFENATESNLERGIQHNSLRTYEEH